MKEFSRTLKEKIKSELKQHPKSMLILGPRQVGKSTLIKSLNPDLSINLADESLYLNFLKDPELLGRQLKISNYQTVFIDEIQRIPSLLNTIQSIIDNNKKIRFFLTGSSARKLKRSEVNLLPGRIFRFNLHPLTFWELEEKFQLDKCLTTGSLPEVYLNDYGIDLLSEYSNTYLKEEIQREALVRNLGLFSRFLDLCASSSGEIINYNKLASDSEIPKESLRRYFEILIDSLIVHKISGFQNIKGSRKANQKDKYIFFDLGVANAINNRHKNKFSDTELGHLFEQWFILQIIAWRDYYKKDMHILYYRDDLKNEVDLVLETTNKVVAIEIKYAQKTRSDFFKGLKILEQTSKKPCMSILIFRGLQNEIREEVSCYNYVYFLKNIDRILNL